MGKQLRLDKFLADMGVGTRSELKTWIRKSRVRVNDEICRNADRKVDPEVDRVYFDDKLISYIGDVYLMLHKPMGVVSATVDNLHETVLDLIDIEGKKDVFPVGRLDIDTEGLLFLTNDGDLAHRLLSPRKKVDKVYYAKVEGRVSKEDQDAFLQGVDIGEDEPTMPAKLHIISSGDISEIELTIQEGKFHQVKRMFQAVGKKVTYLKRISMGGLSLDSSLALGEYRNLTTEEIAYLKSL